MAGNNKLVAVKDRGWLNGFGNYFRKECHAWWGTWQWVIQIGVWLLIVDGMLAMVLVTMPRIETARIRQEIREARAGAAMQTTEQTALMVFFMFAGLAPAVGTVVIAQDALIGERQSGTAAWVLSKPISRPAFLLAKFGADSLGVLLTMVAVQGCVSYFIYKAGTGIALPLAGFAGALGLVALLLLFYLSLTYMLGTLLHKRGAVIGIPMVLIFGYQLSGLIPGLGRIMPWNLVMDLGPDQPSLGMALAQGQPLHTLSPILGTAAFICLFIAVAVWRLQREEF